MRIKAVKTGHAPKAGGELAYDYTNQAWVRDGIYLDCNHPETMDCGCYGRDHEGEPVDPTASVH